MVDINTNNHDSTKYSFNFLRENTMIVTKEFITSSIVPNTVSTSISSKDYINESNNIIPEQIENIMFREVISP